MTGAFRIEAVVATHDRSSFSSGVEPLDSYLRERATQDIRRRVSACYVALESGSAEIGGYYTLAAGGVILTDLHDPLIRRLPRYPSVPVARLGRLAIGRRYQGQRLGAALLWDAALHAARSEVTVFALGVDAKDDTAAAFYQHHGFVASGSAPRQFILSLANVPRNSDS